MILLRFKIFNLQRKGNLDEKRTQAINVKALLWTENLRVAVGGETHAYTEMYPPMLQQAIEDDHRAKRMFGYAMKAKAAVYFRGAVFSLGLGKSYPKAVTPTSHPRGKSVIHENEESNQIRLESKIAFQEKAIADLNEALINQTRTVLELQRRIELLEKLVRGINQRLEDKTEPLPYEKPPHY
jgi:uncharacterized coiled-coil protein SlyX